jgi:hypothetical protein
MADGASASAPANARPAAARRRRAARWAVAAAASAAVLGLAGWLCYVGWEGSRILAEGDEVPHGCATPAEMGWAYEAVNYDVALDAELPRENPDWLHDCPRHGAGTAGSEVVAADGVRLAGWYIPAGDGDPPTAPTVVVVHGWGVSKSDTLRYAVTMHDEYNLLLVDLRSSGRSSGTVMTMGVKEAMDVRAMLDWLAATKQPARVVLFGDSGGAAAGALLAGTDTRIGGLILESPAARMVRPLEQTVVQAGQPMYPPTWAVEVGIWLRTGAWIGDADPIDVIPRLGTRPLAIIYGGADDKDLPDQTARLLFDAARAAGGDVEIHECPDAPHGRVVDTCPEQYREWVGSFLARAFAGS